MKLLSAITIAAMALGSLLAAKGNLSVSQVPSDAKSITTTVEPEVSDFEKAVALIKKYEGLHQPKHYPLVGYGHLVLPGEKFSRNKALSEAEADKLLRKDLLKNCAVFRDWGKDSLILGVLAYNIGSGNALRSSVAKKLKSGDRDIYSNYISHARYRGKVHSQIQKRRIEEYETLFIKDTNPAASEETEIVVEQSQEKTLALAGQNPIQGPVSSLVCSSMDLFGRFLDIPVRFMSEVILPSFNLNSEGSNLNQPKNTWMACI